MFTVRKSEDRGHLDHGWLDARHTFSFGSYLDRRHMGFRSLRVMNEDRIAPGRGFGTHPHEDMEIVTLVLEGALAHEDSLGTGSTIVPGEIQRMTAGTGIAHSESNASGEAPVHLYQIWLFPGREGLTPSYDQRAFPAADRRGRLQVVASPDGRDGSLTIGQDARLFLGSLDEGDRVTHLLEAGRHGWVQVLRGRIDLNGLDLSEGDGASASDEPTLAITARVPSEVLVFDLS